LKTTLHRHPHALADRKRPLYDTNVHLAEGPYDSRMRRYRQLGSPKPDRRTPSTEAGRGQQRSPPHRLIRPV